MKGATHRWQALGIALVGVAVAAAACGKWDMMTGEYVYNYTETPVTVFYVVDGQERQISEPIEPGGVATIENRTAKGACFDTGSLLARDPSGRVVARLDPGPLCPSQSWFIGTPPSASP